MSLIKLSQSSNSLILFKGAAVAWVSSSPYPYISCIICLSLSTPFKYSKCLLIPIPLGTDCQKVTTMKTKALHLLSSFLLSKESHGPKVLLARFFLIDSFLYSHEKIGCYGAQPTMSICEVTSDLTYSGMALFSRHSPITSINQPHLSI